MGCTRIMSPVIEHANIRLGASIGVARSGAGWEETKRTVLGVELISNVREGDPLYELLIKQPVL